MEIGYRGEDLTFVYSGNVKFLKKGTTDEYVNLFDKDGNPNMRLKSPIILGDPNSTEASDGFYYYDGKFYGKVGGKVIDMMSTSQKTPITPTNQSVTLSLTSYDFDGNYKTPTVTVKDGDTVISSEEYNIIYKDNIHAGTATVVVTDKNGGDYSINYQEVNFTINKINATIISEPIGAEGLEGSGPLIETDGRVSAGTMKYYASKSNNRPSNTNNFIDSPYATEPGNYYIWYYADCDGYEDYNSSPISQNYISVVVDALENLVATITKAPTGISNLIADGTSKNLINRGEANNGTIKYCISNTKPSNTNGFDPAIPTATEHGTYKIWYYVDGNSGYDDSDIYGPLSVIIAEKEEEKPVASFTEHPTITQNAQTDGKTPVALIDDEGEVVAGEVKYCISNSRPSNTNEFKSDIPTATTPGNYNVWYYIDAEGTDYLDSEIFGPLQVSVESSGEQGEQETIVTSATITENSVYNESSGEGNTIPSNSIKVIIKNNSNQLITNLFSFNFVNDTIGSGNFIEKWPLQYIDPNNTVEEIIEVSYKEQHFGKSIESASIYNVDNGQYISCNAFSGSPIFNGGSTITLVYGGSESSTVITGGSIVSDKSIVVKIKNTSKKPLTLNGIIRFQGSGLDTNNSNNDPIRFSSSNVTILSNGTHTSDKIEIKEDYRNKPLDKIYIYSEDGKEILIEEGLNTTFLMGATYTINYTTKSGARPENITKSLTVTENSVYDEGGESTIPSNSIKVIIKNNSNLAIPNTFRFTLNPTSENPRGDTGTFDDITLIDIAAGSTWTETIDLSSQAYKQACFGLTITEAKIDDSRIYNSFSGSPVFNGGSTITLVYGGSESSTVITGGGTVSNKNIVVTVKNNTEGDLVSNGTIKFFNGNNELFSISNVTINKIYTSDKINIESHKGKSLNKITILDSSNKAVVELENLNNTLKAGATYNIIISSGEQPQPGDELFETLLGEFNTILNKNMSLLNTPNTYKYLSSMYNKAETEWNKDASNSDSLFNSELYPEVVEYRNTSDNSGNIKTHEAMQAWLMAMCLAELTVSSGSNTNNLTKLYAKAIEYGDTDVYKVGSADDDGNIIASSNYGYKQDAMIARFAAGAVYAINHDNYIGDINDSRKELYGNLILADRFNQEHGSQDILYKPNLEMIIPATPGPYALSGYGYESPNKKVEGQSDNIIYGSDNSDNLKDYNYKMDYAINKYVVRNYNLWDKDDTDNAQNSVNTFKNQSPEIRQIVFESGVIMICSRMNYFGKKKFKYLGEIKEITNEKNKSCWLHKFELADNTYETCGENEYWYKGPFSDWYDKLFTNSPALNAINGGDNGDDQYINGTYSGELEYLQDMLNIFDNRLPIYGKSYGRRRPLGGIEPGTAMNNNYNHDPINGFLIQTAAKYLADNRNKDGYYFDKVKTWDDFPTDPPKSYPSGHSAQAWGMAMLLSQINPSMVRTYMKNGWRFGCERAVARAHWNSDILFGRLSALADLPIINAMNGKSFMNNYNSLRGYVHNSEISKSGNSVTPSGDKILYGKVNITIVNNSGVDLTNEMNAVMLVYYWPSGSANHINASVALKDNSSESDVTYVEDGNPNCRSEVIHDDLRNGKSVTFENACFGAWTSNSSEYVPVNGISLETPKDDDDDKPGNVKFFINLYSNFDYNVLKGTNYSLKGVITGEDGIFKNGGTYTVTIDSYTK